MCSEVWAHSCQTAWVICDPTTEKKRKEEMQYLISPHSSIYVSAHSPKKVIYAVLKFKTGERERERESTFYFLQPRKVHS